MNEKRKLPKGVDLLAKEAIKYESAEKFAKVYSKIFDRLMLTGEIDAWDTGLAIITMFGTGKKGLINFYNEISSGIYSF